MGVHLLSVTVYNPIDPGFDPHKSRKPGPKGPQIWTLSLGDQQDPQG